MIENDEINEILPNENLLGKKINKCITFQVYKLINEKKNTFQDLKKQRNDFLEIFKENNKSLLIKHDLKNFIITKHINVGFLKNELFELKSRISKGNQELNSLKNRITKKRQKLNAYSDKIQMCKEMVKKSETVTFSKTNNDKDGLNILKLRLIEYEKQRIEELNRYVFDLTEIKQKIDEDILQKSTRTALKDARQTVYVNGRWILANDHVLYRIIRSVLPSDADYLSFFKDSMQNNEKSKDESHQLDDIDQHFQNQLTLINRNNSQWFTSSNNQSLALSGTSNRLIDKYSILSGLTYTIQFVNLIGFYLNIVLPYNLPHSKFCTQTLKTNQFQNAVAKLNTNIVFLSIHQHIPVTNLLPKHTLENLYHFLVYFKEMRVKLREKHSVAFPSHMIPLLEEMFTDNEEESIVQDAIPNLIFNDNEDWETVPNSDEIPTDDSFNAQMNRRVIATPSSLFSSVISQFWPKQK